MTTPNHDPARSTLYGADGESRPRRAASTRRLEPMTAKAAAMIATPKRQVGPRRASSKPGPGNMLPPDEMWALIDFDATVN